MSGQDSNKAHSAKPHGSHRRGLGGGTAGRVGVDVGGTFTDLVYSDGHTLRVVKVPSTPPDFELGVGHALHSSGTASPEPSRRGEEKPWSGQWSAASGQLPPEEGAQALPGSSGPTDHGPRTTDATTASPALADSLRVKPCHLELIHGSTVATNALLERKGEPIAFITTAGFRDLLHIGRQNRPELYNLHVRRPPPIVPREKCWTVRERIGAGGEVVELLDERQVEEVARDIAAAGLVNVAVCLLFSFVNPQHERRVAAICQKHGLDVTLSSEVVPEFREYERASTTAITATLRPTMQRYLSRLRETLPANVTHVRILHGGGGTYALEDAAANAGRLVLSGPAGGVAGAAMMARLAGFPDAVGFDMGGTSTDVALIRNGRPHFAQQHTFDGLPMHLPMLDIHTIGAGGGSVAYLDPGGSLRVGPRSAGARPGPACYGRGGVEPTVTDANVVLGRIPTDARFGELRLRPDLARSAMEALAARLGTSVQQAALGVLKVAEQNMAGAVRVVTAQRGHDPRRLALVSFGGAGGLHACAVAELLGMTTVILPPMAGVLSALGMVAAADSVDVSQTVLSLEPTGSLDDERLQGELERLNQRAMEQLPPERTACIETFADCRWAGQSHELTVPVESPQRAAIAAAFAAQYAGTYGAPPPGRAVEIVTLRLRRVGRAPEIMLPPLNRDAAGAPVEVDIVDQSGAAVRARSTGRAPLLESPETPGPLLLIDPDATAFVPRGWSVACRPDGIVIARRNREALP